MSDNRTDLEKPQINSTLKLLKDLEDINLDNNVKLNLPDEEIEKINEKASVKLNMQGQVYEGLVSVEPNQEDFLKFLEMKNRPRVKPQIHSRVRL